MKVCILELDNLIFFSSIMSADIEIQQVMVPLENIFQDMEGFFSIEMNVNMNGRKLNFLGHMRLLVLKDTMSQRPRKALVQLRTEKLSSN